MIVLIDTSVLLPALWRQHKSHAKAKAYLDEVRRRHEVAISAHGLAELFAGLTGKAKYRPAEVLETLRWVRSRFVVQPLAVYDYMDVIEDAVERNVLGGGIYDALHARAAAKAGASKIAHGDKRSYPHLWSASKLVTPLAP